MTNPHAPHDDKYIVFKADEFRESIQGLPFTAWSDIILDDAVVIRRQDLFASPALATYASMIAIAAKLTDSDEARKGLLKISDYFEQQAQAAADEGWKVPDA